jgi:hypothetical protein
MTESLSLCFSRSFLIAILVSPALAPNSLAQVVVAPTTFASTEGDSGSNFYPLGGAFGLSQTTQWIISSSELGLTAGDTINGLAFRTDASVTGASPVANLTYSSYQITLGTAATTPATISDTFADNFASSTVVRTGSLTLLANSQPGGTTPNSFGSVISIAPFTYTGGDLVIEVRSSASGSGESLLIDNDNAGTGYGSTYAAKVAFNNAATTASLSGGVPITQFSVTPVPEPATYGILSGLGLGAFALIRRFKRA